MNIAPRQSSLARENKKLRRLLNMARSALLPYAGNVREQNGSDLTTFRCHYGIQKQDGTMMGPEECGRCSRELFARRTVASITSFIGEGE